MGTAALATLKGFSPRTAKLFLNLFYNLTLWCEHFTGCWRYFKLSVAVKTH